MFVNSNKQRFIGFSIPPYSRYLNIVDIREGYLQFTVENTEILHIKLLYNENSLTQNS